MYFVLNIKINILFINKIEILLVPRVTDV